MVLAAFCFVWFHPTLPRRRSMTRCSVPKSLGMRNRALAWLLPLVVLATGCSDGSGATDPESTDRLTVMNISPAAGTTLRAGQRVVIRAQLEYDLRSTSTGQIALLAQSADQPLQETRQPTVNVSRGSNVVVLTDTVTVAVSRGSLAEVQVFFPLFPLRNGVPGPTRTVTQVRFPVQQ
jgi:hypothetical protein